MLASPRFAGYFGANLVSNIGTWLQNTAQMLLAYQLTHSAFAVGLVTCAQFAGFLVVGPWAGVIADRVGPRRLLVVTQVFSALIAADLAYLQHAKELTERDLVLGALAIGLGFTFALPIQTALIPRLLPAGTTPGQVKAAMAMNSVAYNAGRALAPVLAVILLLNVGAEWAFAINAISFLAFAVTMALIRPTPPAHTDPDTRPDWNSVRVARLHPRMLLLMAMVVSVTLADDPVLVLGPALAHQVLHVSSAWPAYFLSALGLGTIVGALIPTRPPTSRRAALPLLMLSISMIVFVCGAAAWISWIAAFCTGVGALLTGSSVQAELHAMTPPRQAPQVMAMWAVAWAGSKPLASLCDGWLGTHLGVLDAGVALATPALVVAALELWMPPALRERTKTFARQYRERRDHLGVAP